MLGKEQTLTGKIYSYFLVARDDRHSTNTSYSLYKPKNMCTVEKETKDDLLKSKENDLCI